MKIFIAINILLLIAHILQYLEPIQNANLGNENYLKSYTEYNEFIMKRTFYALLNVWMEILGYIVIAIIIFSKRNKLTE